MATPCAECGGKTVTISPLGSSLDWQVCEQCGVLATVAMRPMPDPCRHHNITSMRQTNGAVSHICTDCGFILTAKQAHAEHVRRDTVTLTIGESICKALNLDASRVTSLRLAIEAGSPPILEVNRAILGDEVGALRNVFERYELTPLVSAPQAADQEPTE